MQDDKELLWKTLDRRKVAKYPIFEVFESDKVSADGMKATYIEVEAPLWVNVIAVIERDGEPHYLMVRQFRHGSGTITTEFPAGLVDPGEEPRAAAARELLEETGYEVEELVEIGSIAPNPAFMTNRVYTYLAVAPRWVGEQKLDEDERVHPVEIPCSLVDSSMGSGDYDNGIIMIAWSFYQRYLQEQERVVLSTLPE